MWRFVDYDLVDFIWDCPHCGVRVGHRDDCTTDTVECSICTCRMKVLSSRSVERIETDPDYHDAYIATVELSHQRTKAELLMEVDTVMEDLKERLSDARRRLQEAAAAVPAIDDFVVEDMDGVIASLEVADREFHMAVKTLSRESYALKRYVEAPIP